MLLVRNLQKIMFRFSLYESRFETGHDFPSSITFQERHRNLLYFRNLKPSIPARGNYKIFFSVYIFTFMHNGGRFDMTARYPILTQEQRTIAKKIAIVCDFVSIEFSRTRKESLLTLDTTLIQGLSMS